MRIEESKEESGTHTHRGRHTEKQRERQGDREKRMLLHNFHFLLSTLKVMFYQRERLLSEGGK